MIINKLRKLIKKIFYLYNNYKNNILFLNHLDFYKQKSNLDYIINNLKEIDEESKLVF